MPENSGDSAPLPEEDPNATTRSFDAFTPAPYAAEPNGTAEGPAQPPYFAYPPSSASMSASDAVAPAPPRRFRTRSVAIIGGVVLLVCGLGAGAYAVWGTSSPSSQTTSAASVPVPGATKAGHKGRTKIQTARVTITAVNGDTLTGTTASGASITIDITSETKFGTKARPLTAGQIVTGDVVIVRGERTGSATYDATEIAMSPGATSSTAPGASGAPTPGQTGSSA